MASVEADRSIITSSVPAPVADPEMASDEATIRNAVTSAYLGEAPEGRIPWANVETGSRGEISEVSEFREGAKPCRTFRATIESFTGVRLFNGETCLGAQGNWIMRAFRPA